MYILHMFHILHILHIRYARHTLSSFRNVCHACPSSFRHVVHAFYHCRALLEQAVAAAAHAPGNRAWHGQHLAALLKREPPRCEASNNARAFVT